MLEKLDKRLPCFSSPDAGLYGLAFAAMPCILYLLFSVLSYFRVMPERMNLYLGLMASAFLALAFFLDNVSMLLFGRICRKNFKGVLYEWPMQCYALLILVDIMFMACLYQSDDFTVMFFKYPGSLWTLFIVNMAIPVFLVPLPASARHGKLVELVLSSVMVLLPCMLFWFEFCTISWLFAGYSLDENIYEYAYNFFKSYPNRLFTCGHVVFSCYPVVVHIMAVSLFAVGSILHLHLVSGICSERLRNAFPASSIVLLASAVASFILFTSVSNMAEIRTKAGRKAVSLKHGRSIGSEQLNKLYYGEKTVDDGFWKKAMEIYDRIHENASSYEGEEGAQALFPFSSSPASYSDEWFESHAGAYERLAPCLEEMDGLLDGVEAVPKCGAFREKGAAYSGDVSALLAYIYINNYRIVKYIKEEDCGKAMDCIARHLKAEEYLLDDVRLIAGRKAGCSLGLRYFLSSGKASPEQAARLLSVLSRKEERYEELFDRIAYCDDVRYFLASDSVNRSSCIPGLGEGEFIVFPSPKSSLWILPQYHWHVYSRLLDEAELRKERKFTAEVEQARKSALLSTRMDLLLAAREMHRCENGKYPQSAEDLVPKYMKSLQTDPFTGLPLE